MYIYVCDCECVCVKLGHREQEEKRETKKKMFSKTVWTDVAPSETRTSVIEGKVTK